MPGSTAWIVWKAVLSVISSWWSSCSGGSSTKRASAQGVPVCTIPAALTRISSGPSAERAASASSKASERALRSAGRAKTSAPCERSSSARSWIRSVVEVMATAAPSRARRRALAKPIPSELPQPVTRALRPVTSHDMRASSGVCGMAVVEAPLEALAQVLAGEVREQPGLAHLGPGDLDPALHVHVDAVRRVQALVAGALVERGYARAPPERPQEPQQESHGQGLPPSRCDVNGSARERFQHLVRVPFRVHSPHLLGESPVGVDHEGRALDAHELLAVHVPLSPDAVVLRDAMVAVGEQRERQVVLPLEALVGALVVGADAEHDGAPLAEGVVGVADPAGLSRAAGGVVLGVEVEDDRPPAQSGELYGLALV